MGFCCSFNTISWWDPSETASGNETRPGPGPGSGPRDQKKEGQNVHNGEREHWPNPFGPDGLARSNSASSMLGLSVLLHVNIDEYYRNEDDYYGNVNHYFGFRV